MNSRTCQECNVAIAGRSDKKFCSDSCRNAFNNRQNSGYHNYSRRINSILRRNRSILEKLNPSGKVKRHKDTLSKEGFDFSFYTNTYRNKSGEEYRFCYDFGYLELDNSFLLLVRREVD